MGTHPALTSAEDRLLPGAKVKLDHRDRPIGHPSKDLAARECSGSTPGMSEVFANTIAYIDAFAAINGNIWT